MSGGNSSQLPSSSSGPREPSNGACSVCGATFRLVESSGVLRKHGHNRSNPPCLGSGRPPTLASVSSSSGSTTPPCPLPPPSTLRPAFDFHRPSRAPLKRIPRGARLRAATVFEERVRGVINKPEDVPCWIKLLEFGACLVQPDRGGKRHNLTKQVLSQIDRGTCPLSTPAPSNHLPRSRKVIPCGKEDKEDEDAAKRASIKLDCGDIRGAVRCLCSDETMAEHGPATLQLLMDKHPPAPLDRRNSPVSTDPPLSITSKDVLKAVKSFTPGSAGGPDGLRPQHLADMVGPQGGTLLDALTELMSLILSGGVPDEVRPTFFGATLFAFAKKDGGVRPIAVGLSLRRLASKIANSKALDLCSSLLAPRQLGVGIKGGAEALAHAARRFLYSMKVDEVFVKLDFSNAFNSIRRDAVLEATAQFAPALVPYVLSSYGSSSNLWFGKDLIASDEGLQQGDPLGPLLFCLSVHNIVSAINSEFVSGYLDDLGVGGRVSSVINDIKLIELEALKVGLSLNHLKCEIICSESSSCQALHDAGLFFSVRSPLSATLLGTPLHVDGVEDAVRAHVAAFSRAVPRLSKLSSHEALFLIKNSLAIPKLQYVLRTAACFLAKSLKDFDDAVLQALTSCIKVALDSSDQSQLSLLSDGEVLVFGALSSLPLLPFSHLCLHHLLCFHSSCL